jgi:signal transduction histidine kinase
LVRECLATFAPLASAAGVTLMDSLDERSMALVDPAALSQIVLNLLDNAVKYGPYGQTIRVGSKTTAGRVRLTIEDEGPGIPPEERDRVWQPFVRLGRDRNGAVGGSGIGLAVVHELASLHDGRVWVETGMNGGARFVFEMESAGKVPAPAMPSTESETPERSPVRGVIGHHHATSGD